MEIFVFNAAISACEKGGEWVKALERCNQRLREKWRVGQGARAPECDVADQRLREGRRVGGLGQLFRGSTSRSSIARSLPPRPSASTGDGSCTGTLLSTIGRSTTSPRPFATSSRASGEMWIVWDKALELLSVMSQGKVGITAFNAAISACEKGGEWEKALERCNQRLRGKWRVGQGARAPECDVAGEGGDGNIRVQRCNQRVREGRRVGGTMGCQRHWMYD